MRRTIVAHDETDSKVTLLGLGCRDQGYHEIIPVQRVLLSHFFRRASGAPILRWSSLFGALPLLALEIRPRKHLTAWSRICTTLADLIVVAAAIFAMLCAALLVQGWHHSGWITLISEGTLRHAFEDTCLVAFFLYNVDYARKILNRLLKLKQSSHRLDKQKPLRYDCFLSHNWGEGHANHKRVARINDALKQEGIVTWCTRCPGSELALAIALTTF